MAKRTIGRLLASATGTFAVISYDSELKEYSVWIRGTRPETKYFTTDRNDAISTAERMIDEYDKQGKGCHMATDTRVAIIQFLRDTGLDKEGIKANITLTVNRLADKERWTPAERACSLADWYGLLDRLMP